MKNIVETKADLQCNCQQELPHLAPKSPGNLVGRTTNSSESEEMERFQTIQDRVKTAQPAALFQAPLTLALSERACGRSGAAAGGHKGRRDRRHRARMDRTDGLLFGICDDRAADRQLPARLRGDGFAVGASPLLPISLDDSGILVFVG